MRSHPGLGISQFIITWGVDIVRGITIVAKVPPHTELEYSPYLEPRSLRECRVFATDASQLRASEDRRDLIGD